ncbi:MAG: orotidine-5'-phosphate decarboxylase [Lachnospiraceae bacterium]|nr:orotidine-5'-phosphate decarboxylase [Lachnospiraceae bacterium]
MIRNLIREIQKKEAPIVVGLDPAAKLIPQHLIEEEFEKEGCGSGEDPAAEAFSRAIIRFNERLIDSIHDLVPAVKPQIAMYEQFGIPGLYAYRHTVEYARKKGLIVIADIKRGDIGSTSEAYAMAHLGKSRAKEYSFPAFDADFATVNPYLGSDGVMPFVEACNREDRGIFVLVKTSNPSSGEFQDRPVSDGNGRLLYELVADKVREWGELSMDGDYSNVGAVTGATYPEQGRILRKLMPKTYFLVPGYGAQGGTAKDLAPFFNEDGLGAIVNSSRGIIGAYRQEAYASYGEERFDEAAREAVLRMRDDLKILFR